MQVTRNIISNFFGQFYTALLGLIFLPYYLDKLGAEAFSLIGIYSLLQAWLHLMDGGLTATIGRETSKFLGGGHTNKSFRILLRSIEILSFAIAILMIVILSLSSGFISYQWLKPEILSPKIITSCIILFSFIIALRFIEGLYKSILNGLQKQLQLNILIIMNATIRWGGSAYILKLGFNQATSFYQWQLLSSIIATSSYCLLSYSYLPKRKKLNIGFSFKSIGLVKKFAFGMLLINFFSLLVGQMDKIVLSKVLTMETFGYYTLAASIAGFTYFASTAITNAHYPLLCKYKQQSNTIGMARTFHSGSRLVTVLIGSASIYFVFFCKELLQLWISSDTTVNSITLIVQLLIIGNFINTLIWIPYHAQLACGWTSITVKTNAFLSILMPPMIYFSSINFGLVGAALISIIVNSIYITISLLIVFPKILPGEKKKWILNDTLKPIISILAVTLILRIIYPTNISSYMQLIYLLSAPIFLLLIILKIFKIKNLEVVG